MIFAVLAATSNKLSVRKLGARWKVLHRLVYAGAILTFLHRVMLAFDPVAGYIHAGVLLVLESLRLIRRRPKQPLHDQA